jgi:hypothetical protein
MKLQSRERNFFKSTQGKAAQQNKQQIILLFIFSVTNKTASGENRITEDFETFQMNYFFLSNMYFFWVHEFKNR